MIPAPSPLPQLFGGPQGFMVSTNVAETDEDHATTLYRFVRHLLSNLQHVSGSSSAYQARPSGAHTKALSRRGTR